MTLTQLKAVCAAYHQKSVADLTQNGYDLFLDAANTVRQSAENLQNFEASRVRASLAIDSANGGNLQAAVMLPASSLWKGISTVITVSGLTDQGFEYPLSFSRKEVAMLQDQQANYRDPQFFFNERYPSDATFQFSTSGSGIVQVGQNLFIYPRSTAVPDVDNPYTIYLEGYAALKDYDSATLADSSYSDYFLANGYAWLKWAIIHELNWLFSTFVPRQEGNVGPVEKKRDEEWRKFQLWNDYLIDPNSTNLT